jgi:protein arginine kinase
MNKNDLVERMVKHPSVWIDPKGPFAEIVFSSRIRFARNVQHSKFSLRAKNDERQLLLKELSEEIADISLFQDGYVIKIDELSAMEKEFLIERHLVSFDLCFEADAGGVVIDSNERVSIMINEEDHMRIQGFAGGLQLFEIFDFLNMVDDEVGLRVDYAFDDDFGYLTACPTNLGTGMRASALIHLPALVITREIEKLVRKLKTQNILVRGLYGEGSEIKGNFFQLSSSTSLGKREEEILMQVSEVVKDVVEKERNAREVLMRNAQAQVEDKIWRAYGLLKYSCLLTSDEVINLSSAVRLGVGLGVIRDVTLKQLNKLLIYIQPAHMQLVYNRTMDNYERDRMRALFVKEILSLNSKGSQ